MTATDGTDAPNPNSADGNGEHFSILRFILTHSIVFAGLLYVFGVVDHGSYWEVLGIQERHLLPEVGTFLYIQQGLWSFLAFLGMVTFSALLSMPVFMFSKTKRRVYVAIALTVMFVLSCWSGGSSFQDDAVRITAGSVLTYVFAGALLAVAAAMTYTYSGSKTNGTSSRRYLLLVASTILLGSLMMSLSAGLIFARMSGWEAGLLCVENVPSVKIYSEDNLHINDAEAGLSVSNSRERYKYHYQHLGLISRNSQFTVVVGPNWERGEPLSVIKNESIRIDIQRPPLGAHSNLNC